VTATIGAPSEGVVDATVGELHGQQEAGGIVAGAGPSTGAAMVCRPTRAGWLVGAPVHVDTGQVDRFLPPGDPSGGEPPA
jgi:hypothetical protein